MSRLTRDLSPVTYVLNSDTPFSAKVTNVSHRSIRRDAEHRLLRRARRQLHKAEAVIEGAGRTVCRVHGEVHATDALLTQRGQQGVHQLASETLALEFGEKIDVEVGRVVIDLGDQHPAGPVTEVHDGILGSLRRFDMLESLELRQPGAVEPVDERPGV